MSVADSALEGMWREALPTISLDEFLHWLITLGVDVDRTIAVEFTIRRNSPEDGVTRDVYLKVTQRHYVDGKAWADAVGNIATETVYVPVTHLGNSPG